MNGKQKTLFESWGSSVGGRPPSGPTVQQAAKAKRPRARANAPSSGGRKPVQPRSVACGGISDAAGQGEEDDDAVLLVAAYEAEKSSNSGNVSEESRPSAGSSLPGFDLSAGDLWIYPTNYPVRDYQVSITETALLNNTLVCLPTGLGKTFIAAVLMYNFYRWYPSGRIVFMAPTKPLVAQQMEACYKVMGIPQEHMAEMTGSIQALNRKEIWNNCRVFFLTPQVMVNDLYRGACPAAEVKCLVIDEAHKAQGNHAYCQAVQQVVSNLLIARIELRSEDSPDIQSFSHERLLKKFVVPLSEELVAFQNAYLKILETFADRLIQYNVLSRRDIPSLTKYQIILERDQFRKNPPTHIKRLQQGVIEGDFALCISLYHGYELLLQMGTRSLFIYLRTIMDGTKGMNRAKNELGRNAEFMHLYLQLETTFTNVCAAAENETRSVAGPKNKSFIYSHPKLKKLEEVVVEHFKSWKRSEGKSISDGSPVDTRVMIFSSFRDSVQEIAEMLHQHQPSVRVMTFVGQSTGKSMKGFTQKEQLEVVKRFREGGYNTLVSTCVGEEGLDIGEVDLIICFDAQKSPIRLVQRMGRTGRKRQGRIVVILSAGREERIYNQSQSNKKSIYKAILGNNTILHLCPQSPRMVPDDVNPKVHKMYITQKIYEPKNGTRQCSKDKRSSTACHKSSLFHSGTANKKNSKGHWALTTEEFEVWNRIYRIQESDGIKNVKLPRVHFETIDDMEEIVESDIEDVHELSLSEWRVWQNRPFPTYMIDHSDRCKLFINVMDKIEMMRYEDNCKYVLEMPYLHKDDIKTKASRKKGIPSVTETERVQKSFLSAEDVVYKSGRKHCSSSFEPDQEFISLFKGTGLKGTKRSSAVNVRTSGLTEEYSFSERNRDACDTSGGPLMECTVYGDTSDIPCETVDVPVNEEVFIEECCGESCVPCDVSSKKNVVFGDHCDKVTNHTEALINQSKLQLLGRIDVDSGYGSFTDEMTSVTPNMFYPFEIGQDCCIFAAKFIESDLSKVEAVLTNVKRFLSQSPPPLDKLCDLEEIQEATQDKVLHCNSLDRKLFPTITEKTKETKSSIPIVSSLFMTHEKSVTLNAAGKLCNHSEMCGILEADDDKITIDPIWDKIFDCDDEEDMELEQQMFATMDHAQTNTTSDKSWTEANECMVKIMHGENHRNNFMGDQDNSMDLFEIDHGNHVHTDEHVIEPDLHETVPIIKPTETLKISDSCMYNECNKGDPGELLSSEVTTDYFSEILEKTMDSDINYSQELFSVNFDLGFCILDSDNDLLGADVINPNSNMKANDMQYNHAYDISARDEENMTDTKLGSLAVSQWNNGSLTAENMSTPVTLPSGNVKHEKMSVKHISKYSPLNLPAKKVCSSPTFMPFTLISTPIGKSYMNVRSDNITPSGSICKVQQDMSLTPATNKSKVYFQAGKNILLNTTLANSVHFSSNRKPNKQKNFQALYNSPVKVGSNSESEDEIVFQRKRRKGNVLKSPEVTESDCDFDSPVRVVKKHKHLLNTSDLSGDENNCHNSSGVSWKNVTNHPKKQLKVVKRQKSNQHLTLKSAARQFLDEEAMLSSEGAEDVSSDESGDSADEENVSILEFLDDNTQLSQGLNDSEMYGVYQKSVRNITTGNPFKMVHKRNDMTIFSQIPEQDETYMEDSFCVQEDEGEDCERREESSEEVLVNFDLVNQDSFVGGRKQYCTRRRLKLKQTKSIWHNEVLAKKKKGSRIIVFDDSSEEEMDIRAKTEDADMTSLKTTGKACQKEAIFQQRLPRHNKTPIEGVKGAINVLQERWQAQHNLKNSVSKMLDFQTENGTKVASTNVIKKYGKIQATSKMEYLLKNFTADTSSTYSSTSNELTSIQAHSTHGFKEKLPLCILVDSREVSSGPEVISSLKIAHAVKVEVCCLGACDYIVSNRLAVERKSQLELANSTNRNKLIDRIQRLQSMFERICVVVEKDRIKAGDNTRIFHRTKYYDSILSSMVSAGIRILFSSSQENTADLLKELALTEYRKHAGILIPTEVTGHKKEILQFYLSVPHVSYLTALNMCHHYDSIKQMADSSVNDICTRAQVSHQKAEEIYHYMHYIFESQLSAGNISNGKEKRSS
ncbi:Fanconi anemia group M protein isoform X2 [Rhinatrema bivittatum]|uniref:Fanconi anemia group M protein isoform X2 n=1 Tax=Rhinatrema bivittatum TaxID=194408 RepID=UPI0011267A26|nr:Fanconi anemia group M protein isoform X2 [Rhinatrema bivittatum]